ncbi:hypothetical protein [Clostridium algidicarnis]|uniref:hypothetical protein n=1 Tax=Clostridium algidicarnis TaxID=37659 RepID=UPI001C0CDD4E|nr:hypothetical protein [Clostridium algidicarnis]MBU3192823.1 hypothetical protein [Clostridium algidicarnis]
MVFDYLNNFNIRMKKIGYYSLIFRNSIMKNNWKKYGFDEYDEQENLIFTVLLYIMEQSLKEEVCTLDNITDFIDEINDLYYKKNLSYEEEKSFTEFIINTILCNDGNVRYYMGFNYETEIYEKINVNYLITKIIDIDGVRRVTYSLTDDGYNMLLGTLEIEENLRISIHEMIFKLHLAKAEYSKAADDIKNIFNMFRIRVQKMEEDIQRIRENPLNYSNSDYGKITKGNLALMKESKEKYKLHREVVEERIQEFLHKEINLSELTKEENENLNNLQSIKRYLNKTIDEDQRILKKHFELKEIYAKELENISKMSIIKRFSLSNEIYEKVLEDIKKIENIEVFLRPLFKNHIPKRYNINKALQYQNPIRKNKEEKDLEVLEFSDEDVEKEKEQRQLERLEKYKTVINVILENVKATNELYLSDLNELMLRDEYIKLKLIPTVEIFREVIIEFLKVREVDINSLLEERKINTEVGEMDFQLNKAVIEVIEENKEFSNIKRIYVSKALDKEDLIIKSVINELGETKNFICSEVYFKIN